MAASDAWVYDGTQHWHACAKTGCAGRVDAADHFFAWVIDVEATTEATGLKHEECGVCHAKRNEDTVIEKLPAPSTGGYYYAGPTVTAVLNGPDAKSATDYSGGIYGLIFRSTAGFSGFRGVQVDGKTIAAANYTAEDNGGIEVYLKAVYLQTLAAGKHTLTILSSAGDVTVEFTVNGGNNSPKTFDAGVGVYAVTTLLSLTGMAWVGKKKI